MVLGALLLLGCLLGLRMGFKALIYPPILLILWIIFTGVLQSIFVSFVLTIKEKPIVDDWLDWPEFADQRAATVPATE
jgi:hypothetical protein